MNPLIPLSHFFEAPLSIATALFWDQYHAAAADNPVLVLANTKTH